MWGVRPVQLEDNEMVVSGAECPCLTSGREYHETAHLLGSGLATGGRVAAKQTLIMGQVGVCGAPGSPPSASHCAGSARAREKGQRDKTREPHEWEKFVERVLTCRC